MSDAPDPQRGQIDLRRALILTVGGLLLLVAGVAVTGQVFREPLIALSRQFVAWTGVWGPAAVFLVADAITAPIPPDVFMALALVGGVSPLVIGLSCSVASIVGGSIGYVVGGRLRRVRFIEAAIRERAEEAELLVQRYGAAAVAFAALTPFPYFIVCWTAGALRMPFRRFLLVSLLRFPRVFGYLWLIKLGALDVLP